MRSILKPKDLFQRAKDLGQNAVAVTDHASMAGMWDCLKAARQVGIKFIPGCEFNFVDNVEDESAPLRTIVLLARNAKGYENLLSLGRRGFDNYIVAFKKATPRIDWSHLEEYYEGLICITGDGNGIVAQSIMQKDFDDAKTRIKRLHKIFGEYFALELQPHDLYRKKSPHSGTVDQRFINKKLKEFGQELDVKCVVATDSHYLNKDQHRAHDVLLAIGSGQPIRSGNRLTFNVDEFYVKSAPEVAHYFIRKKKHYEPEFIKSLFDNSVWLAEQCEFPDWIDPKYSNPSGKELPEFPVEDQPDYNEFLSWVKENHAESELDEDKLYLRYRCELGFKKKVPKGMEDTYRERLDEELEVIEYRGFSSYMLIVMDYIEFARKNNIPVGPSRGSIASCLIGYLVNIHIIDPIKYNLIFARFLNKYREEYPDIDEDIGTSGRDKVIDYVRNKYGPEYVAHVSNINAITPKVYVRDIARTFNFGDQGRTRAAEIGNAIADSIPASIKTIKQALEECPLFIEYTKVYPELAEFADTVAGAARAWSTHAAGVIIGKRKLTGLVPLRRDRDGTVALEYDKERAEANGLVKMDFLGLSTLDICENTYKIIESVGKPLPPNPIDFYEYDQETYDLISRGDTFGVFQLTGVAAPVCRMVRPKTIEDISLVTALIRPAAKDIIKDFMDVRSGNKDMELIHPNLQRALGLTCGFGLFEECLMYIASDIAGWNLHQADDLRKMTKNKGKYPEKVEKLKRSFIEDAPKNKGISEEIAERIWEEIIAGFGGYGFNMSHATSYSVISYYTAYLKAHYPLEFLVANLMFEVNSNSPKAKDNIIKIKDEIRAKGVNIVSPDINKSETTYKILDDNTLMTGLDSMKYMNKDAMPAILEKRPFNSFEDFISKIANSKVQAQSIQALAASGALDSFGLPRKTMFLHAKDYKEKYKNHLKKDPEKRGEFKYPFPKEKEWNAREKYALEVKYLGEGFSGTVNERYEGFFNKNSFPYENLKEIFPYVKQSDDPKVDRKENSFYISGSKSLKSIKGVIVDIWSFAVKKEDSPIFGQEMARVTVQDPWNNKLDLVCFPDCWQNIPERLKQLGFKDKFEEGIAMEFNGVFQYDGENSYSMILNDILDIKEMPQLPADLKGRKVKLPRTRKTKSTKGKKKEELAEELESEFIDDGVDSLIDDEEDTIDPFN